MRKFVPFLLLIVLFSSELLSSQERSHCDDLLEGKVAKLQRELHEARLAWQKKKLDGTPKALLDKWDQALRERERELNALLTNGPDAEPAAVSVSTPKVESSHGLKPTITVDDFWKVELPEPSPGKALAANYDGSSVLYLEDQNLYNGEWIETYQIYDIESRTLESHKIRMEEIGATEFHDFAHGAHSGLLLSYDKWKDWGQLLFYDLESRKTNRFPVNKLGRKVMFDAKIIPDTGEVFIYSPSRGGYGIWNPKNNSFKILRKKPWQLNLQYKNHEISRDRRHIVSYANDRIEIRSSFDRSLITTLKSPDLFNLDHSSFHIDFRDESIQVLERTTSTGIFWIHKFSNKGEFKGRRQIPPPSNFTFNGQGDRYFNLHESWFITGFLVSTPEKLQLEYIIYDLDTQEELHKLAGPTQNSFKHRFLGDGLTVSTGAHDKLDLWRFETREVEEEVVE